MRLFLFCLVLLSVVFIFMADRQAIQNVFCNNMKNNKTLLSAKNLKKKKHKTLLILLALLILGGCCAKTPVAVVKKGQIISLRECEIYSECPLDEVSLRQIARNNELLK